jgi:hypothetical protein
LNRFKRSGRDRSVNDRRQLWVLQHSASIISSRRTRASATAQRRFNRASAYLSMPMTSPCRVVPFMYGGGMALTLGGRARHPAAVPLSILHTLEYPPQHEASSNCIQHVDAPVGRHNRGAAGAEQALNIPKHNGSCTAASAAEHWQYSAKPFTLIAMYLQAWHCLLVALLELRPHATMTAKLYLCCRSVSRRPTCFQGRSCIPNDRIYRHFARTRFLDPRDISQVKSVQHIVD